MHLQREVDVVLFKHIEDGAKALRKISKALVPIRLRGGREGIDRMPHRRAGEARHRLHAKLRRCARRVCQLGSSALTHAFGLAVAPHVGRQDGLVALVNQIAHGLAHQMVADGKTLQAVLGQQCVLVFDVLGRRQRLLHVEMVAPAGQLQAVVAHAFRQRREFCQWQVGPLAGEEGDGSWHGGSKGRRLQLHGGKQLLFR
ncbi:hypothetical protein D3C71_1485220 [compost metagenome]